MPPAFVLSQDQTLRFACQGVECPPGLLKGTELPSHQNNVTFQCAGRPVPNQTPPPAHPFSHLHNVKEQTRLRGEAGLYALLQTEVNEDLSPFFGPSDRPS
jgi:hypothetical protein